LAANPTIEGSRRTVLLVAALTVAYTLSFADRQVLSLLLEPIRRDLRITDVQASLLQGLAFSLIYASAGIPIGLLADRMSRRNIVLLGVFVWSLMTVLCGFAGSFGELFIGRFGVGIGEAALLPAAYSMLADSFAPEKLPRATSVFALGPAIGTGCAYILGSGLLSRLDGRPPVSLGPLGVVRPWQAVFILVGLLGIVAILMLAYVREPTRRSSASRLASSSGLAATLRFIKRHAHSVGMLIFAMSMLGIQAYGSLGWLPSMMVRAFHEPIAHAGLILGATYSCASVSGIFLGAWCATNLNLLRTGNRYLAWSLLCAGGVCISGLIAPLWSTPTAVYATAGCMFVAQSAWMGSAIAAVQLAVPAGIRASLTAVVFFCTNVVGLTLGPSGVAAITQYVFHDPSALPYAISMVSGVSGALAVLGMALSFRKFPPLGLTLDN
jgi:MFS family permease